MFYFKDDEDPLDVHLIQMMDCIRVNRLEEASQLLDDCCPDQVEQILAEYGFKLLGMGAYSVVFQIPGETTAIKMNYSSGDKWYIYAKYALSESDNNPMLPKIYSLHINMHNEMSISRVEKLDPSQIRYVNGMPKVVRSLGCDIRRSGITKRTLRNRALKYLKSMFDMDKIGDYSQLNLASIVIWLSKRITDDDGDVGCDFHGANWMLRGKQLVLNDPIA